MCGGDTGHAEGVEITFDPNLVSFGDLLHVFWDNHNPTTLNRQGPDHGTQYRSAIFYASDDQREMAESSKAEIQKNKFDGKGKTIVTEIVKAGEFYEAEDYHQQYLEKQGRSSCRL